MAVKEPKTWIDVKSRLVFTIPEYITRVFSDLLVILILASLSWFFSVRLEVRVLNSKSCKLNVNKEAASAHEQVYVQSFLVIASLRCPYSLHR